MLPTYALLGALAATGGARPTAIGVVDGVLLALGALAIASCARRARTVPVYVAAAAAAVTQPEVVPMLLGVGALVAAFGLQVRAVRRRSTRRAMFSAAAGGLAWAALVGAPDQPPGAWWPVPLIAFAWLVVSARRNGGEQFQRRWNVVVIATGGAAAIFSVLGAFAVLTARADVERGARRLDDGLAAARAGDTEGAQEELDRASSALDRANNSLGAFWAKPALLVPGVSQNARSLMTAVDAAADVAGVAADTAEEVDLERFGARAGQLDFAAIAAVEEPLGKVIAALEQAQTDLAPLSDLWLLPAVKDEVTEVQDRLADASTSARLALDGVRVVPDMVGADGPRTYLVLFTSPVEARARTGFPANFAEITFNQGRFDMTRFGRILELNEALPESGVALTGPEDFLDRYSQFQVGRDWRNVTLSPDFPSVAEVSAQLYSGSGLGELDGVMSMDPTAMAALLELTGPVEVPDGPTLNPDNAEDFLLRDQYIEFADSNTDRKDALEVVASEVFGRLSTLDLPGPRALGRLLAPAVETGHLQFYAFAPGEPEFLAALGVDGAFPEVEGDFIGFTTTNAAGNKIDIFLERHLSYSATWDPTTGNLEAAATITLTNNAPTSGLPDYLTGNALGRRPGEEELPVGWHRVYLTLYSPWGSTDATVDGQPLGLNRKRELSRYAYAAFIDLPPGESREVTIQLVGSYEGSEDAASESGEFGYALDVISQPMVIPDRGSFEVTLENAHVENVTGPLAYDGSQGGDSPKISADSIDLSRSQSIFANVTGN